MGSGGMSNPVERWQFHGLESVKTIASPDGRRRLQFGKRPEGSAQFYPEELSDRADEGQPFSIWVRHPLGGIYPDLDTAEADARRIYHWLDAVQP
jgi:hypothetical protein